MPIQCTLLYTCSLPEGVPYYIRPHDFTRTFRSFSPLNAEIHLLPIALFSIWFVSVCNRPAYAAIILPTHHVALIRVSNKRNSLFLRYIRYG
jgi:hypothetical protein